MISEELSTFASRKYIRDFQSFVKKLLGSKRALYLVNTSEEFLCLEYNHHHIKKKAYRNDKPLIHINFHQSQQVFLLLGHRIRL